MYYYNSVNGEEGHTDRNIPTASHVHPTQINEGQDVDVGTHSNQIYEGQVMPHTQDSGDCDDIRMIVSVVETSQNVSCEVSLKRRMSRSSSNQGDDFGMSPKRRMSRSSYYQDDKGMMSSKEQMIRPSCDVHIVYDTHHAGADAPVQLVILLEDELDKQGYTYTDFRDCLPGRSTMQQQVDFMTQADFIVCFISKSQQTAHVFEELIDHVRRALTIKQRPGLVNRVIPVFCNVTEEQVKEIRDARLPEMMLVNHIIARHGDLKYI